MTTDINGKSVKSMEKEEKPQQSSLMPEISVQIPLLPPPTEGEGPSDDSRHGSRCSKISSDALAKQWIRRALTVHLPVVTAIIAFLILLGCLLRYITELPRETLYSQVDYSRTHKPLNLSRDLSGDGGIGLRPYNQSFPGDFNVLLEPHLHTIYSDGRLSVRQTFDWALLNGFNSIVLTDHNNAIRGYKEALKILDKDPKYQDGRLVVLPGMEYTCCRIHMNLIGFQPLLNMTAADGLNVSSLSPKNREAFDFIVNHMTSGQAYPTDQQLQQLINATHQLGGLVSVNHMPWSTRVQPQWSFRQPTLRHRHPTRRELLDWGVDYFEVTNGDQFDLQSLLFVERNRDRLGMLTGTDMHRGEMPNGWTILRVPKGQNITRQTIMKQLRDRETSILFDAGGAISESDMVDGEAGFDDISGPFNPAFEVLRPLIALGYYVESAFVDQRSGMPSFQGSGCYDGDLRLHSLSIGMFVVWVILIFISIEFLCFTVYWLILKRRFSTNKSR